jgi:hypothetical protein
MRRKMQEYKAAEELTLQPVMATTTSSRSSPRLPLYSSLLSNPYHHEMSRQHHQRHNLSPLERLPQEVFDMVARRLDYASLLRLRTLSRHLQAAVDPSLAPADSKFALVMRAERDMPRNRGRLACYLCYTVKAPRLFAENQPIAIGM